MAHPVIMRSSLRTLRTTQIPRSTFRTRFQGRRFQSTDGAAAAEAPTSFLSKLWNSPVGVKTVHFWAPVMKWAIVITGISDFYRPAEKLSLTQNLALTGTGLIWTRWCFIIKPKNYLLAAVNFFLGCVGIVQVSRILSYQRSLDASGASKALEEAKDETVSSVKDAVKGAQAKIEKSVK